MLKLNLLPAFQKDAVDEKSFKGAEVIAPHEKALKVFTNVLCHDFASLYPSIIIAFNISPETRVLDPLGELGDNWQAKVYTIDARDDPEAPHGELYFLKQEIQRGVLPAICEEFVSGRKALKDEQKRIKVALDTDKTLSSD